MAAATAAGSAASGTALAEAPVTETREGEDGGERFGPFRLPKNRPIHAQAATTVQPERPPYRKRLTPKYKIQQLLELEAAPLHPAQLEAVTTTEGPVLILAGAGSGKTRVMTARAAHLIRDKGVDPRSIMLVTFTTKAAEEIRQRLSRQLPGEQVKGLITGTFHSLFYRMLVHHDPVRWDQRRLLKQEWQKFRLLRESGVLAGSDLAALSEAEWEAALAVVSRWKNELILPADAALLSPAAEPERQAQTLYPLYEEAKRRHGWFDFDDMLLGCHALLNHEDIRRRYQERILYLMIDEFQDINRVQYETVKLLAAPQNNLCAIGDDDQSIYAFRGSDPRYILGFPRDYPDARSITLEVNYRSRLAIVSLGYSLIGNNRSRWKKELKSFHADEGDCFLFFPEDEEEQASRIVDEILLCTQAGAAYSDFAILFRTYESTRPLLERLTEAGIPVSFVREQELFYEKQTVRWALAYLRLAIQPDDHAALRDILPTLYISAEQWNALRSQAILDDVPILQALPRLPQWKSYQRKHLEKVAQTLPQLAACTPAQALEAICEDLRLREYVKKRNKARGGLDEEHSTDELKQLLVAAKRHLSIPAFLDHVSRMSGRDMDSRAAKPAGEDAVQLMSIHKAKGLEFDTVFLVDLVEGALPHEFALEQMRQGHAEALEEERRLMYVGITRARHRVCIGVPRERLGRRTRISRFIAEMGREMPSSDRK